MKTILLIIIGLCLGVIFSSSALAATDANNKLFSVCAQNPSSSICQDKAAQNGSPGTNPVNHLIKVATDIVALATGVAAVIFIILGGLTMVTSAGNAEAVANARKRITYAIVGLAVVAFAWAIISFAIDKLIKT